MLYSNLKVSKNYSIENYKKFLVKIKAVDIYVSTAFIILKYYFKMMLFYLKNLFQLYQEES